MTPLLVTHSLENNIPSTKENNTYKAFILGIKNKALTDRCSEHTDLTKGLNQPILVLLVAFE